jgi:hypothetical protein
MSDDNEFDDRFVAGVRARLRTGVAELTAPPTLLPSLRKQYARRVVTRRIAVATAPLAVAAFVVAVAIAPGAGTPGSSTAGAGTPGSSTAGAGMPGSTTAGAGTPGSTQRVLDVAFVTTQVAKAVDNAANVEHDVVQSTATETGPHGKYSRNGKTAVYHNWQLADGSAFRSQVLVDGQPVREDSFGPNGDIAVDYPTRTWRSSPPMPTKNGQGARILTNVLTPAQIKQAMESGHLQIVGQGEVIDGQATIQLRGDKYVFPKTYDTFQIWVNESTYLPVRFDGGSEPADFTWLPPTPENLALLTPPIPAGFTKMPG